MNIDNINDLIKLAGLVKSQEVATEAEVEEADCGCDTQPVPDDMYALLARLAQMGEVHEEEVSEEWANATDHFDGEDRVMDQPKGEPVDTSLRRYLGANGQPVKVEEAVQDHTVEDMMEAYNAFKTDAIEENSEVTEGRMSDQVIHDSETMTKEEFAKKHGKEMADEYYESVNEATVDEAEVEEDNAFNTAAANAKKAGKSEFEFNGKKYKVKMDAKTADALTDDIDMLRKLSGLV